VIPNDNLKGRASMMFEDFVTAQLYKLNLCVESRRKCIKIVPFGTKCDKVGNLYNGEACQMCTSRLDWVGYLEDEFGYSLVIFL